ncbi:MAG: PAS domain S-box protein [Verrucomicrobia bacterium]|nr:PAS domain S-box protein [Verrucomicrobiota bacterium]
MNADASAQSPPPSAAPIRLLYLDDELDLAALVTDTLKAAGMPFTLAAASHRSDFEHNLNVGAFDVVLCDLTVPGLTGLAAMDLVRRAHPHLPVIVLTGSGSEELAVDAMKRGAFDYVLKRPEQLRRLPFAIREAVEKARLEAQLAQAREGVQASEQLYRSLVEAQPQRVFRKDREGRFIFGNQKWCETLGKLPEAFLGKTDFDFYPKHLAEKYRADDQRVLDTGQFTDTVEAHTTPSGARMYVHVVKTPLRDAQGKVIGVQGIFWDETERWQAEAALRESEERFSSFMAHSPAVAWIKDEAGRYLYVNSLFERVFQRRLAELQGKDDFALWPHDVAKQLRDHDLTVLRTSKSLEIQETVPTPDEQPHQWWVFKFPFEDRQGRRFVGGMAVDITEQKRAETRFRDLLESAPDALVITNRQGEVVLVNAQTEALFGYTRQELIGQPVERLVPERLRVEHARYRADYITAPQRRPMGIGMEVAGLRKDGTEFPAEVALSPLAAEEGLLVSAVIRDLTERKKGEAQRLALERKLQDVQKLESLGVLAGGIAHDFNNLLTAIIGNAGLAAMETPEESSIQHFLTNIEQVSLQASALCNQMLAYAGRGQITARRLNLNRLIDEMTHLLQISISKKCVLKFHLTEGLPAVVADSAQVRQIIFNLVMNASEAIGDKSRVVSISTGMMRADRVYLAETYLSPDLPAGDYVYVEISDTGCGMNVETRAKVFDPFFTTKFKGRGLGLAAVLGIVRRHRGAIKVYSELGRGTTFKFLLPCAEGPAEEGAEAAPSLAAWKGAGTVLVVDDEETVRSAVAQQVEAFGFTVLLAADGREAVETYRSRAGEIVAVLLDMTMPHLSGIEAFREMRRIKADAQVILMSGYNEEDATSEFAGKGLAGFLHKPFKPSELREKLHALLPGAGQ